MNVGELYEQAVLTDERYLILLLDFLIKEKQAVNPSDNIRELDRYFKEQNKDKMNRLLKEYSQTDRGRELISEGIRDWE